MKFIDYAKIRVKAGNGGNGCVSFRREKYVPRGGPDGGCGGDGGSVIIIGDSSKDTLLDFHYKSIYKAKNGKHGSGKDKDGKAGEDYLIKVPLGTIVKNENGTILVDITTDGQSFIVAKGGSGGRGNKSFVSSINRAPYYADKGCPGEEKIIILELKLIADIGIIGFPNAGKSTFLSVITKARPKIDAYPFTTLDPNLGVYVGKKNEKIIFADMPGLIEGAHIGTGLGIKFLKHMERTGIFLHFIDTSIDISMIERYKQVRFELLKYSDVLSHKKEIIVATKMDIADCNVLNDFEKFLKQENLIESFFKISSYNNTGIDELLKYIEDIFERVA